MFSSYRLQDSVFSGDKEGHIRKWDLEKKESLVFHSCDEESKNENQSRWKNTISLTHLIRVEILPISQKQESKVCVFHLWVVFLSLVRGMDDQVF